MKKTEPSLKQRAVAYLARREHSRAELARKLAAYGEADDVNQVLDQLQAAKLLSDARFAEMYVKSRAVRFGAARLRQELRQRGVDDQLIAHELAEGALPDELARAREVWQKKFSAAPEDAREWAKQARFLQGRGFGGEIIRRLLKEVES